MPSRTLTAPPHSGAPLAFSVSRNNFGIAMFAWALLAYNVLVILWGALVRATGSGAGCGDHWPLCNGQVIPRAPELATRIELTHRGMSAITLIAVLCLVVWAFRVFPKAHPARLGAVLSLIFVITEASIGAALVLLHKVGLDSSLSHVSWLAIHLTNTFLLVAVLTLNARWTSGRPALDLRDRKKVWMLVAAVGVAVIVSVAGAITALGDTLFPATSAMQGLRDDFTGTAGFLVRLRMLHPMLAILMGFALVALWLQGMRSGASPLANRLGRSMALLVTVQMAAGFVNMFLLAPVWMQIVHLFLADLVWIVLVLFAAERLAPAPELARAK